MTSVKDIVEALLFVSREPLTVDRIRNVIDGPESAEIREALRQLAEDYDRRGGGFFLREVAGGYQLRTRPDFAPHIRRLVQPGAIRLSKAALETLAIIAYKQPVIRSDIEHIRGVDSGGVIRMLLERKLIRVLGRKEIPGRPLIYATTRQFLEAFDLKDLKDLPSPKEIAELVEASEEFARPGETAEASPEVGDAESAMDSTGPTTGDPPEPSDPEKRG